VFGLVVRCKVSGSLCQKRGRRSRRLTGRPGPAGSEHHITCDSAAIPLAILTTAGNVPTSKPLGTWSKPFRRSQGESAGHAANPMPSWPTAATIPASSASGCTPGGSSRSSRNEAARRSSGSVASAGWLSSVAHLHQFTRLAVRWDRHLPMHQGFTKLAATLICWGASSGKHETSAQLRWQNRCRTATADPSEYETLAVCTRYRPAGRSIQTSGLPAQPSGA
jgi:hypothetical protein